MENTLLNNGMATNNPQANVNGVQGNSGVPTNQSQSNLINPITIPIQIQPQITGQNQGVLPQNTGFQNIGQANNNALQTSQNNQTYNPSYQNSNTTNNAINFDQIYNSYQKAYGNTYNTSPTINNSGIKKTSIGTTIVTPTTSNLNSVQGQYQSAYSDTINGIIGNMLSNINNGFQYDPTTDNSLRVATEYAANTTMQSLAGSGVLNSSATSERVARIVADLIPQYEEKAHSRWTEYLGQLADTAQLVMNFDSQQFAYWTDAKDREFAEKEFEYKKKQNELENAWKRVDELGFVDNEASSILGVKVGTLSASAREAKEQREFELNKMREQYELERENDIAITRLKSELDLYNNQTMARYNTDLEKEVYGYKSELDTLQSKTLADYQANIDKNLYSYKSNVDTRQSKILADYQLNNDKSLYKYRTDLDTAQSKDLANYQAGIDRETYAYRDNIDRATYSYKANEDTKQNKILADYQLNNDKSLYNYRTNLDTEQSKDLADYNAQLQQQYNGQLQNGTSKNSQNISTISLATYKDIINNRWGISDPVTNQISLKDPDNDNNDAVWYFLADEVDAGRLSVNDFITLTSLYGVTTPQEQQTTENITSNTVITYNGSNSNEKNTSSSKTNINAKANNTKGTTQRVTATSLK